MREFRLFKDHSGAFEILPVGWSFGALVFNMFWAIGNGLFARFARVALPAMLGMAVAMFLLDIQEFEGFARVLAYSSIAITAGFCFYFSTVAFEWRGQKLVENGYKHIATIYGRTGQQALEKWAMSEDADQVFD